MIGVIMKGIGGFYYVKTECGTVVCHARGKLRRLHVTPMVGDRAEIALSEGEELVGSIEAILPRKNSFIRPPVANIDCIVITFSVQDPSPDLLLVDKLTAVAVAANIDCIICISKIDLCPSKAEELADIYKRAGFCVVLSSSKENTGIDELVDLLKGKTTALAGLSGVGKSSIINNVDDTLNLKTGVLSSKINRGKHTTRHTELFALKTGGYVFDTPGFSSFDLSGVSPDELAGLFSEIEKNAQKCRFSGCSHINEPDCSVKEAVKCGMIAESRYESYKALLSSFDTKRT